MFDRKHPHRLCLVLAAFGSLVSCGATFGQAIDRDALGSAVDALDREAIERIGRDALPVLIEMYDDADTRGKMRLATVFYQLGWKSAAARQALLVDVETTDLALHLRIQQALTRVSEDGEVVDTLVEHMRNGATVLLRDKAGCGLANNPMQFTERQKVDLYRRLIDQLEDPSTEMRSLAIRILKTQTGQTKGFVPVIGQREAVDRWRQWIVEYEAALVD